MNKERKKVMVVIGTRPEATKMGPVILKLKQHQEWFETQLVVTGQHKEQLYQSLHPFGITPDIDLEIMRDRQTLTYVTTAALTGLEEVISQGKPDIVLVHGDTQTTFAAGLAAFLHKVPVGHIEAGLRSHNRYSPWPEEVNRKLVDVVADLLFAPTQVGRSNLIAEGYDPKQIFVTGQTAVDAALAMYRPDYTFANTRLNEVLNHSGRVIAITAHRRENYGDPMRQMFAAIRRIVDDNPDVLAVYPVHLSPTVRAAVSEMLLGHHRIMLLDPIDFPDMVNLMARSHMVMSDSGGLQEESTVFGRPMVLMRDTTERPEAIETGAVYLAGTDTQPIYNVASRLLNDRAFYEKMATAKNPFGDGKASERIIGIIAHYLALTQTLPALFDQR